MRPFPPGLLRLGREVQTRSKRRAGKPTGHCCRDRKSFRVVVICCQVERAVMIDEAKANAIQPATPSENVLADRGLREEVDHGPRDYPEYVYFNFMSIS